MTWFLRKAFRLGPLRLNLSKGGLGASFGVKGFRVGIDPHGRRYVAGGRGGLYFREYEKATRSHEVPEPTSPQTPVAAAKRASWLPWALLAIAVLVTLALLAGR